MCPFSAHLYAGGLHSLLPSIFKAAHLTDQEVGTVQSVGCSNKLIKLVLLFQISNRMTSLALAGSNLFEQESICWWLT